MSSRPCLVGTCGKVQAYAGGRVLHRESGDAMKAPPVSCQAWELRYRRFDLIDVLRERVAQRAALARHHGLEGFNPHRSLHRLIVPPQLTVAAAPRVVAVVSGECWDFLEE